MCARRSLNGCRAERVSQWSLSDKRHVELQTFEKHQEPFLLPLLSSTFQPIETTSEVTVDSCSDASELSNFTCDFHGSTETWRRRPAPSACWVKIIKRRLLWVKGMKVWLTGEITRSVSQSASGTNNLQPVWPELTTPQHISLRSQQTEQQQSVSRGGAAEGLHLSKPVYRLQTNQLTTSPVWKSLNSPFCGQDKY